MKKDNIFTRYDLEENTPDSIQFEMIELPDFFKESGEYSKQAHIHTFYQILWFRKGTGVHHVDFKEYPIANDTLFFISPGQIHYFDDNENLEGIIIHFNESFLSDEGSSENVFLKYNVFNAFDSVPYYNIAPEAIGRLSYIIEEMKLETRNTNAFAHRDYLKYLIKMFLIYIQRIGERGTGIPLCINNASNRMFVRFRQTLELHYKQIHTVKEYANLLNVSTKTLTNSVYESSRNTPLKIINDRITLEAKRQL